MLDKYACYDENDIEIVEENITDINGDKYYD